MRDDIDENILDHMEFDPNQRVPNRYQIPVMEPVSSPRGSGYVFSGYREVRDVDEADALFDAVRDVGEAIKDRFGIDARTFYYENIDEGLRNHNPYRIPSERKIKGPFTSAGPFPKEESLDFTLLALVCAAYDVHPYSLNPDGLRLQVNEEDTSIALFPQLGEKGIKVQREGEILDALYSLVPATTIKEILSRLLAQCPQGDKQVENLENLCNNATKMGTMVRGDSGELAMEMRKNAAEWVRLLGVDLSLEESD